MIDNKLPPFRLPPSRIPYRLPSSKLPSNKIPQKLYVPYSFKRNEPEELPKQNIFDYNDPFEINSFADVILNQGALNRKYQGGLYSIPILGEIAKRVAGTVDLLNEGLFQPIAQGDWAAAGLNLLTNVGETLDVAASPIKGLLQEGPEGFVKALGLFRPEAGRPNYDWDTGNILSDMALEVISDPLNWISFGGAALGKNAIKTAGKEAVTEAVPLVVARYGKEAVDATLAATPMHKFIKRMARNVFYGTDDSVKTASDAFFKMSTNLDKMQTKMMMEELAKSGGEITNKLLVDQHHIEILKALYHEAGGIVSGKTAIGVATGMQKIYNASEGFQKALLKSSFTSNGLGVGIAIGRAIKEGNEVLRITMNQARNKVLQLAPYLDKGTPVLPVTKVNQAQDLVEDTVRTLLPKEQVTDELIGNVKKLVSDGYVFQERKTFNIIRKDAQSHYEELQEYRKYAKEVYGLSLEDYQKLMKTIAEGDVDYAIKSHAIDTSQRIEIFLKTESDLKKLDTYKVRIKDMNDIQNKFDTAISEYNVVFSEIANKSDMELLTPQEQQTLSYITDPEVYASVADEIYRQAVVREMQTVYAAGNDIINKLATSFDIKDSKVQIFKERLFADLNKMHEELMSISNIQEAYKVFQEQADIIDKRIRNFTQRTRRDALNLAKSYESAAPVVKKLAAPEYSAKVIANEHKKLFNKVERKKHTLVTQAHAPNKFGIVDGNKRLLTNKEHVVKLMDDALTIAEETNLVKEPALEYMRDLYAVITQGPDDEVVDALYRYIKFANSIEVDDPIRPIALAKESIEKRTIKVTFDHGIDTAVLNDFLGLKGQDEQSLLQYIADKTKINESVIDMTGESKMYTLKNMQLAVRVRLMQTENLHELMESINTASDIGRFVYAIAENPATEGTTIGDMARHVMVKAEGHQQYVEFFNRVMESPDIPNDMKIAFIDAIENESRTELEIFIGKFDEKFEQLITSAESQMRAVTQEVHNDLEALCKREGVELVRAHNAVDDSVATLRVFHKLTSNKYLPDERNVVIVFDIEATGATPLHDEILQTAIVTHTDINKSFDVVDYRVTSKLDQPVDVIRKIHRLDSKMTNQQVLEYYADNVKNAGTMTQQEVAHKIYDSITVQLDAGKEVHLVGHNSKAFDNEMFINAASKESQEFGNAVKELLADPRVHIHDTLEIARSKYKIYLYSDSEKALLKDYLYGYAQQRLAIAQQGVKTTLNEQLDRGFTRELRQLADHINKEYGVDTAFMKETAQNLLAELEHISYGNYLLRFNNVFESADFERQLALTNMTQLTHAELDRMAQLNITGFVNRPRIKNFFDFNEDQVSVPYALEMHRLSARFERTYNNIAHIPLLDEMSKDIEAVVKDYLEFLNKYGADSHNAYKWNHVYLTNDPRQRAVIAGYLYKEVEQLVSDRNLQEAYAKFFSTMGSTQLGKARAFNYSINMSALYSNPQKYYDNLLTEDNFDTFLKSIELSIMIAGCEAPLRNLSELFSDNDDLFAGKMRAATLAQRTYIETNMELYRSINRFLENATPAEQEIFTAALQEMGTNLIRNGAEHLLNLKMFEFKQVLWHRSKGTLIIDKTLFTEGVTLEKINSIIADSKLYKDQGIDIIAEGDLIIFRVTEDAIPTFKKLPEPKAMRQTITDIPSGALPKEIKERYLASLNLQNKMIYNGGAYSTGNILTSSQYDHVLSFLPENISKKLVPHETYYNAGAFKHTNMDYSLYVRPYDRKFIIMKASGDIIKQNFNTMQFLLKRADSRTNMIASFCDPSSPMQMKTLFKDMSNKEVLQAIQANSTWRIGYLVETKSGIKYVSVRPTSVAQVARLREMLAIPVDVAANSVYHKIFNRYEIVDRLEDSVWGTVTSFYKGIYLVSPNTGMMWNINNLLDSFGRAVMESGNFDMAAERVRAMGLGYKSVDVWMKTKQEIMDMADKLVAQRAEAVIKLEELSKIRGTAEKAIATAEANIAKLKNDLQQIVVMHDQTFTEATLKRAQSLSEAYAPLQFFENKLLDYPIDITVKKTKKLQTIARIKQAQTDLAKWKSKFDIDEYRRVRKIVNEIPDEPAHIMWNGYARDTFFSLPENQSKQVIYNLIDKVLYAVGGGQMRTLQEALKEAGIFKKSKRSLELVWNNFFAKGYINLSMRIENSVRLGDVLYHYFTENKTLLDAVADTLATHYDYSPKNLFETVLEYLIPFSTFKLRNMAYWTEAARSNAWMMRLLSDILTPVFNRDEYDEYELNNNRSLQYNLLSGNIILDNNMTIRLNPSGLEALEYVLNPINKTKDSLYAPIQVTAEGLANYRNLGTGYQQYNLMKEVVQNLPIPFMGSLIQQYWGLNDPSLSTWEKGSGLKATDRTGSELPIFAPGLFGSVSRNYYFGYNNNTVYMTHDMDKYQYHINKGAMPIRTYEDALANMQQAALPRPRYPYEYSSYYRKSYPRRGYSKRYPSKRRYTRRSYNRQIYGPSTRGFFRGTYDPSSRKYIAYTAERVQYRVRNSQMRMPSTIRNLAYLAPTLYKKYFTTSGTDTFKARLLPVSYKNIKYRLRQSWSYLR